jgi:subtilisin-like proprotein convertase family protein
MQDEGLDADFGTLSGTSMATPHVTGVIALVQSLHPDWSADQVIQQVLGTVDVVSGGLNTISGGRLNAAGAVGNPPPDTSSPRIVGSDPPGSTTSAVDHVRIQFSESIDAASFTLGDDKSPSDILSFTGPAGPIPVLAIVPVAGNKRQFDVTFAKQSAEGKYTLVVGPHIRDLAGNELDQNRNGTPGEEPGDQYTASFSIVGALVFSSDDVPAPVRGFTALASYLTIDEDVTISDLNVQLNVNYSQVGSLMLLLVAPSGDYATLSLFNGDGADFQDTTFDDEAPTPIAGGSAPFAGSFQPDEPLSIFDGQSSAGTWTLWVENWAFGGSRGTLSAWSLAISADGAGPPPGSDNQPPLPEDDAFSTDFDAPLVVSPDDLLANDVDPDGDPLSILSVGNPTGGTVDIDEDGMIVFTPDIEYSGPAGFQYVVSDGTDTALGTVAINIQPLFVWHNNANGLDVDNDGVVAPIDAVLVINVLNASGGGSLEHTTALAGDRSYYYDVAADNYVSPLDALTIINYLNAQSGRSTQTAETTSATTTLTTAPTVSATASANTSAPLGALPSVAGGQPTTAPTAGLPDDVPLVPTPTARPRHPASPPHAIGGSPRATPPTAPRKGHGLDPAAVDRALLDLDLLPPHRQPGARLARG